MCTRTSSKADSSSSPRATATGAPAIPRAGGCAPAIADLMSARPRGAGRRPPAHTAPPRLRRNHMRLFSNAPVQRIWLRTLRRGHVQRGRRKRGNGASTRTPEGGAARVSGRHARRAAERVFTARAGTRRFSAVNRPARPCKECRPSSEDFLWEPPEGA
jgi:hypothetical protein